MTRRFAPRYTAADVNLLAYVDKAHGNLSGPATRRILEREYSEYGQAAYQRLAAISVAHLYGFRNTARGRAILATSPRGPFPSLSASGANPSLGACPDTCASTRCIKAIRMGGRA